MHDYTKLVEDLRDIEKTMFALGTSPINTDKISMHYAYDKRWGRTAADAADAIEELQAQLPKRGEWIRVEDGESYHYECSECGERPFYSRYGDVVLSGVCPMCGAKMEVQDGQE